MPQPLRSMYAHFVGEYTAALRIRQHFGDLFINPKGAEACSKAALMLFLDIRTCMIEQILLSLARMVDPAVTMGKQNLSLEGLVSGLPDAKLRMSLLKRVARIQTEAKRIKIYRHKHLAHTDLNQALRRKKVRAGRIKRIDDLLVSIGKVMQRIHKRYVVGSSMDYKPGITPRGTRQLFVQLAKAEAYDALEISRTIPWDEWRKYYVFTSAP